MDPAEMDPPTALRDADRLVAERAAQWLWMIFEQPMLPKAREDFADWLKASPRHAEEFLLTVAVWKQLDGLDSRHAIDLHRLLAEVAEGGKGRNTPPPARK